MLVVVGEIKVKINPDSKEGKFFILLKYGDDNNLVHQMMVQRPGELLLSIMRKNLITLSR